MDWLTDPSGYAIAPGAAIFAIFGLVAELLSPGLHRSGSRRFLFVVLALPKERTRMTRALGFPMGASDADLRWATRTV